MEHFWGGLLETIHGSSMNYTSARYLILVFFSVILYYILPKKHRWTVLLVSSGCFYYTVTSDKRQLWVFGLSILLSFVSGIMIWKVRTKKRKDIQKKLVLGAGITASAFPLIASKCGDFITGSVIHSPMIPWIIPVGLSFYSMQMIAYLTDISRGKTEPQKNLLKYTLFVSFFPVIVQGPVSRYEQLGDQLFEGHSYENERLMRGIQLILWGLFLKYLIADKASVIVNTVFDNYQHYSGFYILTAAVLYSIQLYTDFLSCVTISQGVALQERQAQFRLTGQSTAETEED